MDKSGTQAVIDGYTAAATPELIARFEGLHTQDVYAPVIDLLPATPVHIADIGAGTSRDAAWFARQGHCVLAVEPVRALREAGMALHVNTGRLAWLDDRLPRFAETQKHGPFGLVTLCAVWHHLDDDDRLLALASLARITASGGTLIMSLRHGPGTEGRTAFPVSAAATMQAARRAGFAIVRKADADSVQPGNRSRGVRWTWLVLEKTRRPTPMNVR